MKLLLATLLLVAIFSCGAAAQPPNIIIILTDDQPMASIDGKDAHGKPFMPFVQEKRQQARRFPNSYYAQPVCCPSRTSLLTGMYPHNHGVIDNKAPSGGYYRYMKNGLDKKSWPFLLQKEYFKAMVGKFLNHYYEPQRENEGLPVQPDGWNSWFALVNPKSGFNWSAIDGKSEVDFSEYQTDVLAEKAATIIKQRAGKPFAMLVAPFLTHSPWKPPRRYDGIYDKEPCQPCNKPSFNEKDVSDKPKFLQFPLLSSSEVEVWKKRWRKSLEAGRAVDDLVQTIFDALNKVGQAKNTYVIYASDNGFLVGEHRQKGKGNPYQESVRSWTYVWGPGIVPGEDHHIISNMDFLPTIMEIAGRPIPDWADGRSLLPLLHGKNPPWRTVFLSQGFPMSDDEGDAKEGSGNTFLSLVRPQWTFTRYDGTNEFYDLQADPYELKNKASGLAGSVVNEMDNRLDALSKCRGRKECQPLEDAPFK